MLTAFVKIFHTEKIGENLQISAVNIKEFLRCFVGAEIASSQHIVAVLKTSMKSKRAQKFSTIIAATGYLLLRDAGMEQQIRQIRRASKAVQIYAARDAQVPLWSFRLLREKAAFSLL